jgi:hypothetical protein
VGSQKEKKKRQVKAMQELCFSKEKKALMLTRVANGQRLNKFIGGKSRANDERKKELPNKLVSITLMPRKLISLNFPWTFSSPACLNLSIIISSIPARV